VYTYGVAQNIAISGFYTNQISLAHHSLEAVTRTRDVPDIVRHEMMFNSRFYVKPLSGKIQLMQLKPKLPQYYNPCNPSLAWKGDKLLVMCRAVNYTQKGARNYRISDGGKIFHTTNVLMTYTETESGELVLVHEQAVDNCPKGPYESDCQICGQEDCRLVIVDGQICYSATSLEYTENHVPGIILSSLHSDYTAVTVRDVVLLRGHQDTMCQKNWLPFCDRDSLYFIYGYNPFTILKYDETKKRVDVSNKPAQFSVETSGYRGSAGPLRLPNNEGVLILVHEVCDMAEYRYYFHRFLWLDTAMETVKHVSDLFYFLYKEGVEMVIGMALSKDQKRIFFTIGIEDSSAYLGTYHLNSVLDFIRSPV
jgi:hypothetical protein